MSTRLTSTATFGQLIEDIVGDLTLSQVGLRVIGNLYPHITTEEDHSDEYAVTQHPVETGTPVTDHIYPLSPTVEIRCAWSDSTAATEGFVQAVYKRLLALQATRQPFNIKTGKREYSLMVMRTIGVRTDPESEYALSVVILAQHITFTSTTNDNPASPVSGGEASVGSTTPGKPGELGTPINGGADPAPNGMVTPDDTGSINWANGPIGTGTTNLNTVPTGPALDNLMSQFAQ